MITVGSRVSSFSVTQSHLFDLVNSSCEKDLTTSSPPLPTTTAPTLTQRPTAGGGGGREWEHERHKLRYSHRQPTETNNNNRDNKDNKDNTTILSTSSTTNSKPKPKSKPIENVKGKSRLGLPR